MTIIAYFKDALYADQLVLRYGGTPRERFQRKPKLFMSKCKTFAYAICGSVLTSKEDGVLENMILGQIALAQDEQFFIRNGRHKDHDFLASVFEKLTKFLGASNTHIIAMTSDSVFYINRSGAEFIEQDDFACSGSAEHIFTRPQKKLASLDLVCIIQLSELNTEGAANGTSNHHRQPV